MPMTSNLLDICHLNVRSLNDEQLDAMRAELISDYDVICLSETNLPSARCTDLNLIGFHPIVRKDRVGRSGGGVAVYAANYLGLTRMTELEVPELEAMWVKVKAGNNIVLLCICYRPPNSKPDFWLNLQASIDLAKQTGIGKILITGDLNADPNTRDGNLLKLLTLSNNFEIHVKEPTRFTPQTSSILDQFISNLKHLLKNIEVLDPVGACDHCVIRATLQFNSNFNKPKSFTRHVWQYHLTDVTEFKNNLRHADWDICFTDDIDETCTKWTSTFFNIARMCIPNKVVTIRPCDKIFFTPELRRMRRKKNRLHKQAKRCNSVKSWNDFRDYRNQYNNKIKEAKLNAMKKQAEDLRDPSNLPVKKWWKLAKSFLKNDSQNSSCYPALKVQNDLVTDDKDKAEAFNSHFIQYSNIDDMNTPKPDDTVQSDTILETLAIPEKDVLDLLNAMNQKKASGPDLISQEMLKLAGDAIAPSLTMLFNHCLNKSYFPKIWKRANVIPLHKKDEKDIINNYRPISLLSCVGKLFERAVFKYVYNFLRDTGAISLKQSGFKPGDSTVYQLAHLYHIFTEALDKQKDIRVVFCDISKAFDRVWHPGLLSKLSRIGITGKLLDWFKNYLTDRQQRVVINGQHSNWASVLAGVPQGSVLGPLLFLIYINDITDEVESSEVRLFADDTILYIFIDNPVQSALALNSDLQKISKWADNWLIRFSAPKTKTMTISKKKNLQKGPPLIMDGTPLQEVNAYKHLGVTLSSNLSWNAHIEDLAVRAGQCVDVLNALKYKLDRCTLEKLYFAFVRSKLEYANIIWDNCPKQLSDILENVQYRAAKIVSGAIHRTSHELVYNELGWEYLEERRKKQRLKTLFKTIHGETPIYLQEVLPAQLRDNEQYFLRNAFNIPQFNSRTATFHDSFFPKTIRDWNLLQNDIKASEDLANFLSRLNTDTKHAPKWFYAGTRNGSIQHAKLRMLCSNLNDHLYSHIHVIDNPQCPCGHPRENNKHYFLECRLYILERNEMLFKLQELGFEPSLKNILYGSSEYSVAKNIQAFDIIQNFIQTTARF